MNAIDIKRRPMPTAAELQYHYEETLKRRGTPQTTVDAIKYSVRRRGLGALREPETLERMSRCDEAPRQQINSFIDKLDANGLLPKVIVR